MSRLSIEQERQIKELIVREQKIAAIKLYREATGVGLKEAKDAIEAIERGEPVYSPPPTQSAQGIDLVLEDQIKQLLAKRQKIQAVKIYREAHNCGLKDAKDAVDALEIQMRGGMRTSLPSAPAISNDPFAEDSQRNRRFLAFLIAIVLLAIGGIAFFLLAGNGF
jgi:ribosomal protein L7/L12